MAKGAIKVSYNDFLKIVYKAYPKTEPSCDEFEDAKSDKMIYEFKVLRDIDSGSYGIVKLAKIPKMTKPWH